MARPEMLPPSPPSQVHKVEKRPTLGELDLHPLRRSSNVVPEAERADPDVEIISPEPDPSASPSVLPPAASPSSTMAVSTLVEGTSSRPSRSSQRGRSTPWLHSSFKMPTERVELRKLSHDIAASAAPLDNVDFANPTAATVIGLSVVRRSADKGTYRAAKKTGIKETTNRGGALLAQVSLN